MQRNNLKNIRNTLKMSQLQLANALNLSIEDMAQLEAERKHLHVSVCVRVVEIARKKGVHLRYLDVFTRPEDRY